LTINVKRRQHLGALGATFGGIAASGAVATLASIVPSLASAQTAGQTTAQPNAPVGYPNKPVKLIIPFPPGGSTDIVGRLIAQALTQSMGVNVLVENRGGGGGTIGAAEIARANPDGYVIGMGTVSTLGTAPSTFKKLAYDPKKDYTYIAQVAAVPGIIVVHPNFPAKNFEEFMKELKSNPGKYNYASSGAGAVGHMGMELFKSQTGVYMTHIGYRGAGPALTDVLGGNVPILWDNLSSSLPHVKSGKLRAIGLAFETRIPQLPDLPTFAELGLKNYKATTWFGIVAPAGLPTEIANKLNAEINKVIQLPDVKQRMFDAGAFPMGGTGAKMRTAVDAEIDKWAKVVKFANYAPE
jgi:tripartite-type tricarboxylate transporter receptor subunit TctC